MIERVATRRDLDAALALIARYSRLVKRYQDLLNKHKEMVVHYLELKNMKAYVDPTGGKWQKRQSTSIVYDSAELRKLLIRHHVDPDTVFVEVVTEEINEEVILKLLKAEVITIDEYESVAVRNTSKPYIVKLPDVRKKRQPPAQESVRLGRRSESGRLSDGTGRRA
jgi:hypothetical protein